MQKALERYKKDQSKKQVEGKIKPGDPYFEKKFIAVTPALHKKPFASKRKSVPPPKKKAQLDLDLSETTMLNTCPSVGSDFALP
jgi:hypothetical protein